MEIIFLIAAPLIIGFVLGFLSCLLRSDGEIQIDISDPDTDRYMFLIDDLEVLEKKKHVNLKVSQK